MSTRFTLPPSASRLTPHGELTATGVASTAAGDPGLRGQQHEADAGFLVLVFGDVTVFQ